MTDEPFKFAISLSVLNHLGRNLYRNFVTVLGEAISNAWDADARNVYIDIDREHGSFRIHDDGIGMDADDFQGKFLRIGYSKRSDHGQTSKQGRPFIGAKGIGKLALLSCSERVSLFTRKSGGQIVSGIIDNSGLDEAIKEDLEPNDYVLETPNIDLIKDKLGVFNRGTIIVFEDAKDSLNISTAYLKKIIAMSFAFSLHDNDFNIHVDGETVTENDPASLLEKTEFCWRINGFNYRLIDHLQNLESDIIDVVTDLQIGGFLATVEKPRHLKIAQTNERATLDLFVNGRLREKDILKRIPTQRIPESYMYGQIHFDVMDDGKSDPFTSSREGIVDDDPKFASLLAYLRTDLVPQVLDEWDKLRLRRGKGGDDENPRKTEKQRRARDLYNLAADEYHGDNNDANDQVDEWVKQLRNDAEFNIISYSDCFLAENLVRKYLGDKGYTLTAEDEEEVKKFKKREKDGKKKGGMSIKLRRNVSDLSYLDMNFLSILAEGGKPGKEQSHLFNDSKKYTPIRNVVGHTGLVSKLAKNQLNSTFENMKARIKHLMGIEPEDE